MTSTPGFGFIALWLSLILLSGCMSDTAVQKQHDTAIRQTDERLFNSLEKIRQSEDSLPLSSDMFRRQLALSFEQMDESLTEHHKNIIQLFFQTLPADSSFNIIITVAPTTSTETFKSLQHAWQRLRSLEQQVNDYSTEIELIYQPDMAPDTATLQVIGGSSV